MSNDRNNIFLKKIVMGPLATNCYLLGCVKTGEAVVIDPAEESDILLDLIDNNKLTLKYIINTHGHGDHIGGNRFLKEKYSAKLLIHISDKDMLMEPKNNLSFFTGHPTKSPLPDGFLEDGMNINLGVLRLCIIHTPGHSPGSVSIKVDSMLFTGDTLFKDSIGRTDFPGGSMTQIMSSIKEKLLTLEDDYEVLPGHGPSTTLKQELLNNPWLN